MILDALCTKYKQKTNHIEVKQNKVRLRENHMTSCEAYKKWSESYYADTLDMRMSSALLIFQYIYTGLSNLAKLV